MRSRRRSPHPHSTAIGHRRLREARRPARTARRSASRLAADRLRRVRDRDADPGAEARLYTGVEPAPTKPVDEATQADDYVRRSQLAACQPLGRGMLIFFHVTDESAVHRAADRALLPERPAEGEPAARSPLRPGRPKTARYNAIRDRRAAFEGQYLAYTFFQA